MGRLPAANDEERDAVSRLPRQLEHLKTGFTAEAVSAAHYRAYAARAEGEGLPNLAGRWRELAAEKDRLAVAQLVAAGRVKGDAADLGAAIAEEAYENDVLYPKMIAEADAATAGVLREVVAAQREHLAHLEALRDAYQAATGDVGAEVAAAAAQG
jgi:rubrerythrin